MAVPRYEAVTGSVPAGGTSSVSVPSGEKWIATAYGSTSIHLGTDVSGKTSKIKEESGATGEDSQLNSRPIFSDSIIPQYKNAFCSSRPFYLSYVVVQE